MPTTSINKGKTKKKVKNLFPPQTRVFPFLKMFFIFFIHPNPSRTNVIIQQKLFFFVFIECLPQALTKEKTTFPPPL